MNRSALARLQKQRLLLLSVSLLLFYGLWRGSGVQLGPLFSSQSNAVLLDFVAGFFPPRVDLEFLQLTLQAGLETVAVATLGMVGAFFIGAPLALMISRALSISQLGPAKTCWLCQALRLPFRFAALILRSLPELIWALLFVRLSGLGPMAAILAIAVSYGGMLAKVYDDIMESGALLPARALMLSGAGRLQTFIFGIWPSVYQELLSYSVYRWECALRASVLMGFVGAGGLGQQLELSLRMFNGSEAATLLLAFILLVLLADAISVFLRWLLK